MYFRVFNPEANPATDSPAFKLSRARGLEAIARGTMKLIGRKDLQKTSKVAQDIESQECKINAESWRVVQISRLPRNGSGLSYLRLSTEQIRA